MIIILQINHSFLFSVCANKSQLSKYFHGFSAKSWETLYKHNWFTFKTVNVSAFDQENTYSKELF